MSLALTYVTGVIALLVAGTLLDQYLTRRQPYHLVWSVAFLLISIAMGLWFLRETFGLNQWIFRLWYISGVVLVPAFLGTGIIFLMVPSRVANAILGYLLVASIAAFVLVMTAQIKTPDGCEAGLSDLECLVPSDTLTKAGFFPSWIRVLTAIFGLYGGLAILAGAAWAIGVLGREERARRGEAPTQVPQGSSILEIGRRMTGPMADFLRDNLAGDKVLWQNKDFWRREVSVQRAVSNLIILLGFVLGALGATLNSIDASEAHLGFILVGVLVSFGGLLASREIFETYPHDQLRDSIQTLRAEGVSALPIPAHLGYQMQRLGPWLRQVGSRLPSRRG